MNNTPDLERALETLIDVHGLRTVLVILRDICDGKAEHLAHNWQDAAGETAWNRAAIVISNAADRQAIKAVSL